MDWNYIETIIFITKCFILYHLISSYIILYHLLCLRDLCDLCDVRFVFLFLPPFITGDNLT